MICFQASSANCRKYDEKCKKLRHLEARGGNQIDIDFTRAAVKDLHSRVLVSVQKIDFISKSIEDMRDEDLQPQLDELVGWYVFLYQRRSVYAKKYVFSVHYNTLYMAV